MTEKAMRVQGNVGTWFLVVVVVSFVAVGVWWTLQGRRVVAPQTSQEMVKTQPVESLPTLTASDTITDIEKDLTTTDVAGDDALFSDIDRDLQSL